MKKKAIALLSGGLDSTVAVSVFKNQYDVHAITFNYGQKSIDREIYAAKRICKKLGFKHSIIDLPWLKTLGNSALTTNKELPKLSEEELDNLDVCEESAKNVWVPGRNVVFTSIGLSHAESEGAEIIIVGWDKEEAATFPDNSKEFLESFNQTISIGSIDKIKIEAPLIDLNKKEIVELGHKVNAPLKLSYSCYSNNEKHCGECESCLRRKRAFKESNIEDPTEYLI
jgi:7-cyano-7-deazaguanine synthase